MAGKEVFMKRDETINEVTRCVLQDRNASYGSPENNFSRVAKLWTVYFDREFEPHDVAIMLALLKVARLSENPTHMDSWVDLAGYAVCGAEVAELVELKDV
jgi:hypothetical protein